MGYLMGIDLGSTSLKAVIFDESGTIISRGSSKTIVEYLDAEHPEWAFWHPDRLWEGVVNAVKMAVAEISDPKEILAVAVDGFGMDGLPLDAHGNWLYPFISWHCTRSGKQVQELTNHIAPEILFEKTGKQTLQMDSIYRMMWMKEHHPEILEKTETWLLVEDFINNRLCGSKTIDHSMSWCTSVFDLHKQEWIAEAFVHAGIDVSIMPKVLPSGSKIGVVSEKAALETGLSAGTQVVLGGHDNICSALALGAFQDNLLVDVTGTWEIVLCGSDKANTTKAFYDLGLNVESHVLDGKYCTLGSGVSSDMVEWFRKNYGYEEAVHSGGDVSREWELLVEQAKNAPVGCNGAIFLPHFSGAGTPHVDDDSRGAFVGLSNLTDKGCMLRAIYEGLTFQMKEIIDVIEMGNANQYDTIVVTGGAVKNEFWLQLKADITGKTVVVSDAQESSALGAAILAGIGVGVYQHAEEAYQKTFQATQRYYPQKDVQQAYQKIYSVYQKIYPALREIHKDINWI